MIGSLCVQTLASARRGTYELRQFRAPHGGGTSRSIGRGHGPEANHGGTEEERIAPGAQSRVTAQQSFCLGNPERMSAKAVAEVELCYRICASHCPHS